MAQLHIWVICKGSKMVMDYDFSGTQLTNDIRLAAQYVNRKAAIVAAQAYGKQYGPGYTVKQWQ